MAVERKHNRSTYKNHGCRCDVCTESHRLAVAAARARRRASRALIGGRLTATTPGIEHGRVDTYLNHACRCVSCAVAQRDQGRADRRRDAS